MDRRLKAVLSRHREESARIEFGLDDLGTDSAAFLNRRPIRPPRPLPKGGKPRSHLVIPDTQVSPEAPWDHLIWAGRYAAERRPDVVVHLGDHWDMPSLSSWDEGKRAAENRRYLSDVKEGNAALAAFTKEIRRVKKWKPRLVLLRGNHEDRIMRAVEGDPRLEGTIGYHHFQDRALGWEVHDFLAPVDIDGIRYSHYFPRGPGGTVTQGKRGAPSARVQVQREMVSCTAGHKQGIDIHVQTTGDRLRYGLICGSFYLHDEPYLTPQGQGHWHGVVVKHDVHHGEYDPMLVSLDYLRRRYS